jgi:hypothetical protein
MTVEQGYMAFGLFLFAAAGALAFYSNQLLDEAKRHARIWESRMNEAHATELRCITILDNARRVREAREAR